MGETSFSLLKLPLQRFDLEIKLFIYTFTLYLCFIYKDILGAAVLCYLICNDTTAKSD